MPASKGPGIPVEVMDSESEVGDPDLKAEGVGREPQAFLQNLKGNHD